MKLYPHQVKACNDCDAAIARHGSVLLVAPTGSGKTVMGGELIRREVMEQSGRVLFLAHRTELLTQAQDRIWKAHRIPGAIIQGKRITDYNMPLQIASVQTLKNRPMPKGITAIITDEAHHAPANTYQFIYEKYPDAKMIGLTATPWRLSGKGFTDTFASMVECSSVAELEKMGFLCRAKQFITPMNRVAFQRAVTVSSTGDYNQKELGGFMSSDPMVRVVISSWLNYAEDKQTIIFASGVEQSRSIVDNLRRIGITAAHVDGKTNDDARAIIFRDFTNRKIKVICNVGIATEGTDLPGIECVLLARPTKSLSLYLQMCGRGSRIMPGKSHYNLIDIADCILEHGHPNKAQNWTIEDRNAKAEKDYTRWFRVLLPDGDVKEVSRDNIPNVPGIKALEIPAPGRLLEFDKLLATAKNKGYKHVQAYYAFVKRYGNPTRQELLHMQTSIGLPDAWFNYRCVELKI